jgi:predicted extracellular nuclease
MAILLTITMLISSMGISFATNFSDIKNHWAEKQINTLIKKGILSGYSDGSFKPDNYITRAEFIALINKTYNFKAVYNIDYKDVTPQDWYYEDLRKAKAQGYISGYEDNTIRPNNPITRQEVAVIMAKVLNKQNSDKAYVCKKFSDEDKIAKWSKSAVGALVDSKYMKGYPDGTFAPEKFITRAEAATVIYKKFKGSGYISSSRKSHSKSSSDKEDEDSNSSSSSSDFRITKDEPTLKDKVVEGNLIITSDLGNGNAYLENVIVKGTTYVYGGGEHSIHIKNSELGNVIVNKTHGEERVRLVVEGNTKVGKVTLKSGAILEEDLDGNDKLTKSGFDDVVVESNHGITLKGDFDDVELNENNAEVLLESGSIYDLDVTDKAKDSKINISKTAKIKKLKVDSKITIKGNGKVEAAIINAKDVVFDKKPEKIEGKEKDSIKIDNEDNKNTYTKISEIQGATHKSPLVGKNVTVKGIVTAIINYKGTPYNESIKGFYIQSLQEDVDNDVKTSEGIFIRTDKELKALKEGDIVIVTGKVAEHAKSGKYIEERLDKELTTTEIVLPNVEKEGTGNLPKPVIIGKDRIQPINIIDNDGFKVFDPEEDSIDFYESLEGMLVQLDNAEVVGINKYLIPVIVDNGDVTKQKYEKYRDDNGALVISKSNFNPEVIYLVNRISNKTYVHAKLGDKFNGNIQGIMDYEDGNYKVFYKELPKLKSSNRRELTEVTDIEKEEGKLTIASYNIENYSVQSDKLKTQKVAKSIVKNLKCPDIIALVEVQDDSGRKDNSVVDATKTFEGLINEIVNQGGVAYEYTNINPVNNKDGGAPGGNIRVGFLYNPDRVTLVDKGQKGDSTTAVDVNKDGLTLNPGRVNPTHPAFDTEGEGCRKSLAAEFEFNGEKVFVIANHFSSKRGDDSLYGNVQPAKFNSEVERKEQAKVINDFIKKIQKTLPSAKIVALGDMNDYQFSDSLIELAGDNMVNMINTLPENKQYTYEYKGNAQVLDNILVTKDMVKDTVIDIVNINAGFPKDYRASDHDPVLIQINNIGDSSKAKVESVRAFPGGGVFGKGEDVNITLSTDTKDAKIYYTTDGSEPTNESKEYTGPITIKIDGDTVLKAMAVRGDRQSEVKTFKYKVLQLLTIADAKNMSVGEKVYTKGDVVKISGKEVIIKDNTGDIMLYGTTKGDSFELKDKIEVIGYRKDYYRKKEIVNCTIKNVGKVQEEKEEQLELISIEDARNIDVGTYVYTKGIVTSSNKKIFIQDDVAGICLFNKKSGNDLKIGDEIIVKGKIKEYNNLLEIVDFDFSKVSSSNNIVPKEVSIDDILNQKNREYESMFVEIKNVTLGDTKSNYTTLTDNKGNSIKIYRMPNLTGISKGDKVNIKAVVSIFKENWQLHVDDASWINKVK